MREAPVYRPTVAEFSNFSKYVTHLEEESGHFGIVRVIPPVELKRKPVADDFDLPAPVQQSITGGNGSFRVVLQELPQQSAKAFMMFSDQEKPQSQTPAAIQDEFWRGLDARRREPAVYGADTPGSLFFDDEDSQWNLSTGLQGCLLRHALDPDDKVVGVTTPMLYFGSWRTLFCCHVEDMNLASINFLHQGHEKRWYACGPQDSDRLEAIAALEFPQLKMEQQRVKGGSFLRIKQCLMSPEKFHKAGIPVTTTLQRPNEFVVAFPRAYHWGFNHGTNVAEATNFALESWLAIACNQRRFRECMAWRNQNPEVHVYIDPQYIRRKWLNEPEPEDEEVDPVTGGAKTMGSVAQSESGVKRARAISSSSSKTISKRKKRVPAKISSEELLSKAKKANLPSLFVANSDAHSTVSKGPSKTTTPTQAVPTRRSRPTPGRRVEVWLQGLQTWVQATIRPFVKKDPKADQILVEFDVGGMELLSSDSQWRFKA